MGALSLFSSSLAIVSSPPPAIIHLSSHSAFFLPTSRPQTLRTQVLIKSRGANIIRCPCSSSGPPESGDSDSKAVLDAFFLGKAFAESLSERIESVAGEFLSVIGQWQAEKRKEVMDFQEEVAERAKRAKEKAALESMESRGLTVRSAPSSVTRMSPETTSKDPSEDMLAD